MSDREIDLLREVFSSEREKYLRDTVKELADTKHRLEELERRTNQSQQQTFETAHRSALHQTQSQSHVQRLEGQLKDAVREVEIARQSETVYRDQVQALQSHVLSQSRQLEGLLKEHAELQRAKTNGDEQLQLAQEHAKEAELLMQLAHKKAAIKYNNREKELMEELAFLRNTMTQSQEESVSQVQQQLQQLKMQSTNDALIALNEMKQEYERQAMKVDESWKTKVSQLAAQHDQVEQAMRAEIEKIQNLFKEEREALKQNHLQSIALLKSSHDSLINDLKQTHALEVQGLQERIRALLEMQNQMRSEKDQVQNEYTLQERKFEKKLDEEVDELQRERKTLQTKVDELSSELFHVTQQKGSWENQFTNLQSEHVSLDHKFQDAIQKNQSLSQRESQLNAIINSLTQERDSLKSKYLALGEKLEGVIQNVEETITNSLTQEQTKREQIKQQYAQEREKWKQEKHALLETVSLQERKLIEQAEVNKAIELKLHDVVLQENERKKQYESEKHSAQQQIQQLQQDIVALQLHRTQVQNELNEKIHHIEKLLIEKTHAQDFQTSAVANANLLKSNNIELLEHEFNMRIEKLKNEHEQYKKDHSLSLEKLKISFELEKAQIWKEAQAIMDTKIDEVRASLYSKEQMELYVKKEVDQRMIETSKTLLYPHQHESILSSKLESARIKFETEKASALAAQSQQHNQVIQGIEQKHALKLEEVKIRYENEFTSFSEQFKLSLQDAEQRLVKEKEKYAEQAHALTKCEAELKSAQSTIRELECQIETHRLNESRFLSHIASQSSVIEKLKLLVEQERERVNGIPAEERKYFQSQIVEEGKRWAQEKQLLQANHEQQLKTMQEMILAEQKVAQQLNEQRDSRERDFRLREEKLLSEHRAALDTLQARSMEQLTSLETQHKSLWLAREQTWSTEQEAREQILAQKIQGWEETYKNELQVREQKLKALANDLRLTRERKEQLEQELEQLQKQLRDTVGVLEAQTAKMTRVSTQVRRAESNASG